MSNKVLGIPGVHGKGKVCRLWISSCKLNLARGIVGRVTDRGVRERSWVQIPGLDSNFCNRNHVFYCEWSVMVGTHALYR